jgi:hypothetical protein
MKVFAAREEDAHQGWVWLQRPELPSRCVVRISNGSRHVYCEALQIERNYVTQYNQPPRFSITDPSSSIVLGAWFRAKLGGLQPQTDVPLDIKPCRSWWAQFKACTDHPQVVVRLAAWLGGLGLLLGIIGLALGVISLLPHASAC